MSNELNLTKALMGVGVIAFTWMTVSWGALALTALGALLLVEAFNPEVLTGAIKGSTKGSTKEKKK
tara:strand:+ start:546 stop:743 length:198 start_codon:yes stop_codon:yes gene_type:complete